MAELPESGSDAPIEDRIASLIDDDDSAPEAVADDAVETEEDQTPEEVEEELEGVKLRGRKEDVERIKSERTSKADYTRRTQEAANLAKAAEDRIQYAEAQQQLSSALVADFAKFQTLRERYQQMQSIDIGALYNSDPGQALNIQRQMDNMRQQMQDQEKALTSRAGQLQQAQQAHANRQWEMAVEGAKTRIGSYTPAEDSAMQNLVQTLGFNENELRGRFADARFLHLVYKAAKYDAIASGKATSLQSIQKAPPVVKPGSTNGQFVDKMSFHKAMKKAPNDSRKAELIGGRIASKLGL